METGPNEWYKSKRERMDNNEQERLRDDVGKKERTVHHDFAAAYSAGGTPSELLVPKLYYRPYFYQYETSEAGAQVCDCCFSISLIGGMCVSFHVVRNTSCELFSHGTSRLAESLCIRPLKHLIQSTGS
jgi:hypothetical protein